MEESRLGNPSRPQHQLVAQMEQVLDVYKQPYDARFPVVAVLFRFAKIGVIQITAGLNSQYGPLSHHPPHGTLAVGGQDVGHIHKPLAQPCITEGSAAELVFRPVLILQTLGRG